MCAGVGIADTGGLAGSVRLRRVPANTGEMAAYFAMQKRPPGRGVVVPLPAAAEQAAHLRGEFAGCVSSSLFQQQQQHKRHRGESAGLVSSSLFQQ